MMTKGKYLRKMSKLALITIINSSSFILVWVILAGVLSNEGYLKLFSLTYAIQFIPYIFIPALITGNIILKDIDAQYSGLTISIVLYTSLYIYCMIDPVNIMGLLGSSDISMLAGFKLIVTYQYVIGLLAFRYEFLYFQDKSQEVFWESLRYNLLMLASPCILLLFFDVDFALFISGIGAILYGIIHIMLTYRRFRFKIACLGGLRKQRTTFVIQVTSLLIWGLTFRYMFDWGDTYSLAGSIDSMSSDIQWDIGYNSCLTVSKVELANSEKEHSAFKKLSRATAIFSAILVASYVLIESVMTYYFKADLVVVFMFMVIGVAGMLLSGLGTVKKAALEILYESKILATATFVLRLIEAVLVCVIPTPFTASIINIFNYILVFVVFYYTKKVENPNIHLN